ncbi:MAG TPA: hydroxysqualene dehydroxylase HpnE [Acidimicrobiales bacterium]|nr:hydroxysqualene dehydroxylase HpnE [Acidimicrobiales bacterium]
MSPAGTPKVVVVGGGLAGMAAALACADGGASVTLVEKQARLGGLTWSFDHDGLTMDNGQHVFLRCCSAYLDFLDRTGGAGDVAIQDRLDVTVLRPGPLRAERAVLRRGGARPPLHLARSLLGYQFVPSAQRARLGLAVAALARVDLDDPALDEETFAGWLSRHFQGPQAISELWDLICLPTVNLPAKEASLAMAAKVFQTGLLRESSAADIGWSRVPLGLLHGQKGATALGKAGAQVHLRTNVHAVTSRSAAGGGEGGGNFTVRTSSGDLEADAVIVALPHYCTEDVLPEGALGGRKPSRLTSSPIVNVHVHFDRQVTDLPFAASLGTPAQWVFDRTSASGADRGQYLAVSISAADSYLGSRPDRLGQEVVGALRQLFPRAADAEVLSTFVTKERHATFRAVPGSAAHRAPARTMYPGLLMAGSWTATGWPPTMESAVRSGVVAARGALVSTGQRRWLPPLPEPAKPMSSDKEVS